MKKERKIKNENGAKKTTKNDLPHADDLLR
jgi:hypothetical protein